jgi:hypothetical protein
VLAIATRVVWRTLLLAAPFLLVAAAVYEALLTRYDINFYLTIRPAAFWVAAAVIGAVLAAMVAVLVPR